MVKEKIEIKYAPLPWQREIHEDNHRFRVVCAGRRSGKSVLSRQEVIRKAIFLDVEKWKEKWKGISKVPKFWIVSPTFRQGKEIHWTELKQDIPWQLVESKNEQELKIRLKNGTEIAIKGADNEENLRGSGLVGVILDEAAYLKPNIWTEIISPMLAETKGWALFISTPCGYNWFEKLFRRGDPKSKDYHKDWKSWHYSSYINPDAREEADRAKETESEEFYRQEWLAEFTTTTGRIYKKFSRDINVIKPFQIDQSFKVIAGYDFPGGGKAAAAYLLIAINPDGVWYIIDELYAVEKTSQWICGQILAMTEPYESLRPGEPVPKYCDPHVRQLVEDYAAWNVHLISARKETKTQMRSWIRHGIDLVRRLLVKDARTGKPKLFVFNTCENTIREFETYSWKKNPDPTLNEPGVPADANNHCFTGETLISTIKGNKKIADIKEGELILTSKGYKKVLKKWNNGIKRINKYLLHLDTEKVIIKATPDHKIKTTRGWKQISKLKSGDKIYLFKLFKEKNTDFILEKNISHEGQKDFMLLFGNTSMEKFHQINKFIIKTAIPGTIIFKILNLLKKIFIEKFMDKEDLKKTENGQKNFKKKESKQLKNGILQKKVASGIANMPKSNGKLGSLWKKFVWFVARNIKPSSPAEVNTAIRIVELKRLECVGSWKEKVYDLTIDKTPEYFANGILVHNCMDALRYARVSYEHREDIWIPEKEKNWALK